MRICPYWWNEDNRCAGLDMVVMKSTTIGELKTMEIFEGGRRKCPPHSFTLADCKTGKKLEDDVIVGSIPTHLFGVRYLDFCSCSYCIQFEEGDNLSQNKTFFNGDLGNYCYWLHEIRSELGRRKSERKNNPIVFPGGTVEYF